MLSVVPVYIEEEQITPAQRWHGVPARWAPLLPETAHRSPDVYAGDDPHALTQGVPILRSREGPAGAAGHRPSRGESTISQLPPPLPLRPPLPARSHFGSIADGDSSAAEDLVYDECLAFDRAADLFEVESERVDGMSIMNLGDEMFDGATENIDSALNGFTESASEQRRDRGHAGPHRQRVSVVVSDERIIHEPTTWQMWSAGPLPRRGGVFGCGSSHSVFKRSQASQLSSLPFCGSCGPSSHSTTKGKTGTSTSSRILKYQPWQRSR